MEADKNKCSRGSRPKTRPKRGDFYHKTKRVLRRKISHEIPQQISCIASEDRFQAAQGRIDETICIAEANSENVLRNGRGDCNDSSASRSASDSAQPLKILHPKSAKRTKCGVSVRSCGCVRHHANVSWNRPNPCNSEREQDDSDYQDDSQELAALPQHRPSISRDIYRGPPKPEGDMSFTCCVSCIGSVTDHAGLLKAIKDADPACVKHLMMIQFDPAAIRSGARHARNHWLMTFTNRIACTSLEQLGMIIENQRFPVRSHDMVLAEEYRVQNIRRSQAIAHIEKSTLPSLQKKALL